MPTSILIADDHPVFRRGLLEIISECNAFRVIAEAEDGEQALQLLRQKRPDIALLDISMPKISGLDVLAKTNHWTQRPVFVFLTMYDDPAYLHRALEFGARGYILKDSAEIELVTCLKDVLLGKHYISPTVSGALLDSSHSNENLVDLLTRTERKIFVLIADYKTNSEIADLLAISIRTVENHRANVCQKLDLHGHNALIQFANQYYQKT